MASRIETFISVYKRFNTTNGKKTVNYTWVGGGSPRLRQKAVAPVCSKHQHAIFCYKIGLVLFPPNVGHLMTATLFPLLPSITNNPGFNRYYKPKGEPRERATL
jgi:hypothetical protein